MPLFKSEDNEVNLTAIKQLVNAIQLKIFGLSQILNRFMLRKFKHFLIAHHNLSVIQYIKNLPYDSFLPVSSQLTETFFIKSDYIFGLHSTDKILENTQKLTKNFVGFS